MIGITIKNHERALVQTEQLHRFDPALRSMSASKRTAPQ
jgi:hypothetical protein